MSAPDVGQLGVLSELFGEALERLIPPEEALSVVLQLPGDGDVKVAATPFSSMENLSGHFRLVDPAWLIAALEGRGFRLEYQSKRALPAGKAFWMGIFGSAIVKT